MTRRCVFVTGATGYMGRALIAALLRRGHGVRALARRQSVLHIPAGAETVVGNALEPGTFADKVAPADTLVHLVGTPHPSPAKAASFRAVDLPSVDAALAAARAARIAHFVYVSVAQPAPVMQAYIAVRQAGEARIREAASRRPSCVRGTCSVPGTAGLVSSFRSMRSPRCAAAARNGSLRLGLVTMGPAPQCAIAVRKPGAGRLIAVALVPVATLAIPGPLRALAPGLFGLVCEERVCVDDARRLAEAQLARRARTWRRSARRYLPSRGRRSMLPHFRRPPPTLPPPQARRGKKAAARAGEHGEARIEWKH